MPAHNILPRKISKPTENPCRKEAQYKTVGIGIHIQMKLITVDLLTRLRLAALLMYLTTNIHEAKENFRG